MGLKEINEIGDINNATHQMNYTNGTNNINAEMDAIMSDYRELMASYSERNEKLLQIDQESLVTPELVDNMSQLFTNYLSKIERIHAKMKEFSSNPDEEIARKALENMKIVEIGFGTVLSKLIYENEIFNKNPQNGEEFYDRLINAIRDIPELGYSINISKNLEYIALSDSQKDKYQKLIYDLFGHNMDSDSRLSFLMSIKDKDYVKGRYSILDKKDYNPEQIMDLIIRMDDSKLAKQFLHSQKYKNFKKNDGKLSTEFMVTLLGDSPIKLLTYLRIVDKADKKNIDHYMNVYKICQKLVNNGGTIGSLILGERIKVKTIGDPRRLIDNDTKVVFHSKGDKKIRKLIRLAKKGIKPSLVGSFGSSEIIEEYYKKHSKTISEEDIKTIIRCLNSSQNRIFRQQLIENGEDPNVVIMTFDKQDERDKFVASIREVRRVGDISYEELADENNIQYVRLIDDDDVYTRQQFLEIKKALDKLIGDIPKAKEGDIKSQYRTYKEIYRRIKKAVKYNYYAASKLGEHDRKLETSSGSLYDGLVKGKCICLGMAKILKAALAEKGVDARVIYGFMRTKRANAKIKKLIGEDTRDPYEAIESYYSINKDSMIRKTRFGRWLGEKYYRFKAGGHAWNQIVFHLKDKEIWFNSDITNLGLSKALNSDEEFNTIGLRYYTGSNETYDTDGRVECKCRYKDFLRDYNLENGPDVIQRIAGFLNKADITKSYTLLKETLLKMAREKDNDNDIGREYRGYENDR